MTNRGAVVITGVSASDPAQGRQVLAFSGLGIIEH
jgi:hypothetical protein